MAARDARSKGRPTAQWALMPLEGGKDGSALVRRVPVVEQETGHAPTLLRYRHPDIGETPST